jgi:hypothetical protein
LAKRKISALPRDGILVVQSSHPSSYKYANTLLKVTGGMKTNELGKKIRGDYAINTHN